MGLFLYFLFLSCYLLIIFLRRKRQQIYHFLLTHMSDEHKFQLSAKLCQDVLAAVVDDVIPFDVETSALLQDTLVILASKVSH